MLMENIIEKIPGSAAAVLDNLEKSRVGAELSGEQLLEYERLLNANSKINSYGTVLAALILASALFYNVSDQPRIFGTPFWQVGLYVGLFLIIILFISNLKQGKQHYERSR